MSDTNWLWTAASAGILTFLSFVFDYYSNIQYKEEMKYAYNYEDKKQITFPDTIYTEVTNTASIIVLQIKPTGSASIVSNRPLVTGLHDFYFEVEVCRKNAQYNSKLSIGISDKSLHLNPIQLPGKLFFSLAYNSDGSLRYVDKHVQNYGESYDVGDIIGCGFSGTFWYFTKNGKSFGPALFLSAYKKKVNDKIQEEMDIFYDKLAMTSAQKEARFEKRIKRKRNQMIASIKKQIRQEIEDKEREKTEQENIKKEEKFVSYQLRTGPVKGARGLATAARQRFTI